MTRGQFYSRVMPLAAIAYVIVIVLTDSNSKVVVVGALLFAAIAIFGATVIRSDGGASSDGTSLGRNRNRNRNRGS